jgi:hypothetical protein
VLQALQGTLRAKITVPFAPFELSLEVLITGFLVHKRCNLCGISSFFILPAAFDRWRG